MNFVKIIRVHELQINDRFQLPGYGQTILHVIEIDEEIVIRSMKGNYNYNRLIRLGKKSQQFARIIH